MCALRTQPARCCCRRTSCVTSAVVETSALPRRTVLVVAQASSFAEREFDAVDVVVKEDGRARLEAADV